VELRDTLKAEGYKFNTTEDTEIVCAAYKHWGKDCVKYFAGMCGPLLSGIARRNSYFALEIGLGLYLLTICSKMEVLRVIGS
jgi:hypothetical protein